MRKRGKGKRAKGYEEGMARKSINGRREEVRTEGIRGRKGGRGHSLAKGGEGAICIA